MFFTTGTVRPRTAMPPDIASVPATASTGGIGKSGNPPCSRALFTRPRLPSPEISTKFEARS